MNRPTCTIVLLFAGGTLPAVAADWPQWGGPHRDLVWRETGVVEKLPEPNDDGILPRVWSQRIGEGYAGPAVADSRVYVTDFIRKDPDSNSGVERALCLDAETGRILWKQSWPVSYTVGYPNGPRATPVIDEGRVYTIGAMGDMFCFDAGDGEVLWRKNFVEDFGTRLPTWGMAAAPLVDGEQLITLVGGRPDALVVSFDKKSGRVRWQALQDRSVGYCPPMIFEFGGRRQLVVWHPEAISALEPRTGRRIWEVPFRVSSGLTIPTPRKLEDRLFVTCFYNGPMMVEVAEDGGSAAVVWQGQGDSEVNTDGLHAIMCTPWMNETHIYGVCSFGQLRCLDARTGERIWETRAATGNGRWWNAFLIRHEPTGRFFIHNEQGELIIARLSPDKEDGYNEIDRAKLVEPTRPLGRRSRGRAGGKRRQRMIVWSHPAFAMKSVFARNDEEIVRVDLSKH